MIDWSKAPTIFTSLGLGITLGYFVRGLIWRSSSIIPTVMETYNSSDNNKGDNQEYKMVLVVRNDLKMGKGKACAQCSHGAVEAYKMAHKSKDILKKWREHGQRKVALKVDSEQELLEIAKNARQNGLISVVISDAGRTQVEAGTRTVAAIGPARGDLIDKFTGHLKLY